MTGVMAPAVHNRVCLPRVLNSMPGKQLRSAHDSAASPTSNGLLSLAASIASRRRASATQIRAGAGTASESRTNTHLAFCRMSLVLLELLLYGGRSQLISSLTNLSRLPMVLVLFRHPYALFTSHALLLLAHIIFYKVQRELEREGERMCV